MESGLRMALVDTLLPLVKKEKYQRMAPHLERWVLMRYALDTLHKSWKADEALHWCVRELKKRGKHVSIATVLRSYNKVEEWQREGLGHGRPRTHRKPEH